MPITAFVSLLSLAAAVSWGAADFSGGIASKKTNVYGVVLVAHTVGLIFYVLVALFSHDRWPGTTPVLWGMAAGLVGVVGLMALYRALAVGTMGINAPVAAVITAILPVAFTFLTLGLPTRLQLGGFVFALIAIWMIAMPSGEVGRPKGLGLAIIAGVGFSGFLLFIKLAGTAAQFWPLVGARAASAMLVAVLVSGMQAGAGRSRHRGPVTPRTTLAGTPIRAHATEYPSVEWKSVGANWRAIVFCGIFDSLGNILFVYAATRGRLDIASVLSSLYPASTVVLARVFLKERIGPVQAVGIVLALGSVAMIAG